MTLVTATDLEHVPPLRDLSRRLEGGSVSATAPNTECKYSMSSQTYSWKRFWCPRTGHMSLAEGGYLDDPDSEWGQYSNPDVVSFETIARFPCLGLLGEPGIGKTRTTQAERQSLRQRVEEKGGQILWLDLRSYGSADRLVRNIFQSEAFIAWRQGGYCLHIFLDSLDECLLRIDTLGTLLVDEFQRYSDLLHRLSLRIVCRTATWPSTLEEGLRALWGMDAMEVYELTPLPTVPQAGPSGLG